jgi:hypothetical protein
MILPPTEENDMLSVNKRNKNNIDFDSESWGTSRSRSARGGKRNNNIPPSLNVSVSKF